MAGQFTPTEVAQVRRTAADAQQLVDDFYGVSWREWQAHPYDLLTAGDAEEDDAGQLPREVLAAVVRLGIPRWTAPEPRNMFRILVNDARILEASGRGREGLGFLPLLSYVLTHELVHVVRFSLMRARYEAGEAERIAEEALVHELTTRILKPAMDKPLRRVVDAYRDLWPPERPFRPDPVAFARAPLAG